jgi:hypothetical protein
MKYSWYRQSGTGEIFERMCSSNGLGQISTIDPGLTARVRLMHKRANPARQGGVND